ncbi:hypothetical protein [Natrononativus amylolyticus]|uniref:hypothetical protein n=1 Tax=Natrononativus amylolyticus TaxID=2963434 RepID=UPI0020CFD4A8|nr:hypothetical protein [Natrononativus amylolyticus]
MELTRRALMAGAGGAAVGLAGCVEESALLSQSEERSTEIVDVAVESDADVDRSVEDDPTVSYDRGDGEIRVQGRYSIGNSCYDAEFPEPTYDPTDDTLRVRLSRTHDGSDECEDVDQEVPYRIVVTIDGDPPGVVYVTESRGGEATVEIS